MNARQQRQARCAPIPREKDVCHRPSALPPFESYDEIVRDYIRTYRKGADEDVAFYASTRDWQNVVRNAAFGVKKDGRQHSHYYRRRRDALGQFSDDLLNSLSQLRRAKDFDTLHAIIELVGRPISDIGELTVYDTAERIGARLGLEPQRVYLHCGAEKGARHLGFSGRKTLEMKELPKAFRKLTPREVEDCLCIYREDIRRIAAQNESQ